MLTKMLPDQIAKFWDVIKYALENSPPLTTDTSHEDWVNRVLAATLSGSMEVWASYTRGETIKFEAVIITSIQLNELSEKSLLIYYFYVYSNSEVKSWIDGIKSLAKYAKSRGCSRIIAYSNVPEMISIVEKLGADASVRFISWSINEVLK